MYITCIEKVKKIYINSPADSQMSNQLKYTKYKYERKECDRIVLNLWIHVYTCSTKLTWLGKIQHNLVDIQFS